MIAVECAYAPLDGKAVLVSVQVPVGSCVAAVAAASGLLAQVTGEYGFSLFGQAVSADANVQAGDRVEIIVPLKYDPKLARRQRVEG